MEVEYRKIDRKVNYKPWNCGNCSKLIGVKYNNGILAIKYKDFTGWLMSGEFKLICTFCKSENTYRKTADVSDI